MPSPAWRAHAITVSDRRFAHTAEDTAGPAAVELLSKAGFEVNHALVPDGIESVQGAVSDAVAAGADLVLTLGGTGLSARDQTPEAVHALLERDIPGIAEYLRFIGMQHKPTAVLSRGVAGTLGNALVITLPGSASAVTESLEAILDTIVVHALRQIAGEDHP